MTNSPASGCADGGFGEVRRVNTVCRYALLSLLLLSLVVPAVVQLFPPPSEHASFGRLPHDFIPRRGQGVLQPIPLPAPTGLASYGSSSSNLTTNGVMGSATFDSLNLGEDVIPPPYASNYTYIGTGYGSLQENAVVWIPGHGEYWTQNVIFIASNSTMSPQVELINNIWNFSSPTANMSSAYVHGNGQVASPGFYYYIDPVVYNLTFPFTINLSMQLSNASTGAVEVSFGYSIRSGNGSVYSGVYDSVVLFPSLHNTRAFYQIGSDAPIGLPSDLEYVLGGPGGGSFAVVGGISGFISLYYERSGSFVPVPDAYSYGSDTAETVYFVTVNRNLENPNEPQGVLSSGNLNSYKLWPITPVLEVFTSIGFSQLAVSGYLLYQAGTGSPLAPLPAQALTLELQGSGGAPTANVSVFTSSSGSFSASIPVSNVAISNLVVWYPGSAAISPTYSVAPLKVYSVNLKGVGSYPINIDGVSVNLDNGTKYIVAPRGTQVNITIPEQTQPTPNQRDRVAVFLNGALVRNQTFTLPSTSANITILGVSQYLVSVVERTPTGLLNQSLWYNATSTISLSTQEYLYTNSTSRYAFEGWMVNGEHVNSTSLTLNVSSPLTVEGLYAEQDLIEISTPLSNTTVWAGVGEPYSLSAPPSYGNFLVGYHFKGWSGTLTSSANNLTFTVIRPVSLVAVYSPSYIGAVALAIVLFFVGLGVGLAVRRRV
jgi:hypothetical protein